MPDLDRMVFGRERNADEDLLGISRGFVKAYAVDPVVRARAASGGLVSALLIYALENDVIDAAIVTGVSDEQPWKAVPRIATNRREVIAAGQTKVTLCPTNSILNEALERGFKRLGIVGLPCHVHGIRKIQLYGKQTKLLRSIKFVIGLLCGMTRHGRMPEHVIEEILDVPLDEVVKAVLHGHQYPGLYAVTLRDGRVIAAPDFARRLHTDAFIPDRCSVCYEWAADHADISAGGFLGREAMRGLSGISAAIVRTDIGEKLLKDAEAADYIRTEPMPRYKFFGTGFEGKKHGAPYHIVERKKFGRATPDYHVPIDYAKPVLGKRF
jgi:coenzyme F420 hydrogenase subunit beta